MVELQPGDIVFARGHKWRHWLSRALLRIRWNHVLLYRGGNKILELTWNQGIREGYISEYSCKQIVVLRCPPIPSENAYLRMSWMKAALENYPNVCFDWIGFTLDCLCIPKPIRKGYTLCDEFAQQIYAAARINLDFRKLMRSDLRGYPIVNNGRELEKLYDYRDDAEFAG